MPSGGALLKIFLPRSELARIVALAVCALFAVGVAARATPQSQRHEDPVQTGPVDEPRTAEPAAPSKKIAKGKAAITKTTSKCSTRLIVDSEALFKPGRWTFNPDAGETMDVLAPMIKQAGKRPITIQSYAGSADGEGALSVSESRAITVRGWLVNHGLIPADTPAEGTDASPATDATKSSPNGRVEIVIATCNSSK